MATDSFVVGFRDGLLVDLTLGAVGVLAALIGYGTWARRRARSASTGG